jgi:hypothetical protein
MTAPPSNKIFTELTQIVGQVQTSQHGFSVKTPGQVARFGPISPVRPTLRLGVVGLANVSGGLAGSLVGFLAGSGRLSLPAVDLARVKSFRSFSTPRCLFCRRGTTNKMCRAYENGFTARG